MPCEITKQTNQTLEGPRDDCKGPAGPEDAQADESDSRLIKARAARMLGSYESQIACTSIPAPKIWRRPAKNVVLRPQLAENNMKESDIRNTLPVSSTITKLDEWAREFLFMVELNES